MSYSDAYDPLEGIAIVGMAGRFPGARSVAELWQNLLAGRETITRFSADELEPAHPEDMEVRSESSYVRARGVLADVEQFDEQFFGFSPKEAAVLDPQQRLFLEASWEALEHAGYDPKAFGGPIGVFAGATTNSYYLNNLLSRRDVTDQLGLLSTQMANQNQYMATRVAYKFDLKGPALNIQTACSTSLVAVCTAVQSLQSYQCDMALAGGASVQVPQKVGYLYQEGSILAPDGHCRPFDRDASGTVFSNGLGVVVLRRLRDAIDAGDTIYAVIKGAALNNDGSAKVSFTAPSVDGHAQVIAMAQALAGIDPQTISYVEAHGTGTALGDPIEIAGLTQAFRAGGATGNGFCAIGSLKSNIGHLDAAAGVAGLIKATLALHTKTLPASLNYASPNPKLDIENTPFFVNSTRREWPAGVTARRAGVSSFGVGGTNAHVVLEEAPPIERGDTASRPEQLLLISARDADALERAAVQLRTDLEQNQSTALVDLAYTSQVGRRSFSHRRALVCRNRDDAIALLQSGDSKRVHQSSRQTSDIGVAFMFPGQGAQYVNMGRTLYESEPLFREQIDACAAALNPLLAVDLRSILYPDAAGSAAAQEQLTQTAITQPALFAIEYALAQLWRSWGITPKALIGHSVGEYVAACIGGTFARDDVLVLLAKRARLMQQMPSGAMLAVRASAAQLQADLGPRIAIAALNAPNLTVVSGDHKAIAELAATMSARGVASRLLPTSHAFHSPMMEPIVAQFIELVKNTPRQAPTLPWVSSLTGKTITDSEAIDPVYWARQLREPVRFMEGVGQLFDARLALIEVGPGQALTSLARQHAERNTEQLIVTSLNPGQEYGADIEYLLAAAGQLWTRGVILDWPRLHGGARRQRVALPTYPFSRQRRWVEPAPQSASASKTNAATMQDVGAALATLPVTISNASDPINMTENRVARLTGHLQTLFAELSGIDAAALTASADFLELGLDSLFLTQASGAIQKQFGAKIPIRVLLEDCSTLTALAARLDTLLPPDAEPVPVSQPQPPANAPPAVVAPVVAAAQAGMADGFAQMLAIISRQLEILGATAANAPALQAAVQHAPIVAPATAAAAAAVVALAPAVTAQSTAARVASVPVAAFGPYRPPAKGRTGGLTARQEHNLKDFIARYNQKTAGSKKFAADNRAHLADPRSVAGFRKAWKELVYPIVSVRSAGSKIWDVDGNEYVDLTNGFGMTFFGHNPEFVRDAVKAQLDTGIEIGPQSPLAGEVAKLLCDMVGMERAAFCGTGSEAVTAAIRVARTVTGRDTIVMFTGAYHGIFDEVLVRPIKMGNQVRAMPIAPGIPQAMTDNILVLEYGTAETLRTIKALGPQLAAVLVETVQSRRPEFQPREFLHELRQITTDSDTALVFDEVVTGFRVHPAGAQALFGVRADIATYGKVIGGGLPIGVVAGSAKYLDALDGGGWQYGDDSAPEVGVTFFAGTFVRHPLALAAARAVLLHLKAQGSDLQRGLNLRTTEFVERLRKAAADVGAPIQVNHFSSWFCINFPADLPLSGVFFPSMRAKGVHIWEGRPCFLTLAHSDADLDQVLSAFGSTIAELQVATFLPEAVLAAKAPAPTMLPVDFHLFADDTAATTLALTEPQREIVSAVLMSTDASCAYNQCFVLRFRGPLSMRSMQRALAQVIERHEALRVRIVGDGEAQEILASIDIALPVTDLSAMAESERSAAIARLLEHETHTPFDLSAPPLWRAQVVCERTDVHRLVFTVHHLICDGWSSAVVFGDLASAYSADRFGMPAKLAPPASYRQFVAAGETVAVIAEAKAAEEFWAGQYAHGVPSFELPIDRPRTRMKTYAAAREVLRIDETLYTAVRKMAAQQRCTVFVTLLGVFEALMARLSGSDDLVIGVPMASQALQENGHLVAHGVNTIPLRCQVDMQLSFAEHLQAARRTFFDAQAHQRLTFGSLVQRLKLPRDPARTPLVNVLFNIDRLGAPFDFGKLTLEGIDAPKAFVNFEFAVNAIDSGKDLLLECDYNADLFDATTVQRWLALYRTALERAAADPAMPLALVLAPTPADQQLLAAFNNTRSDFAREQTVNDVIEAGVLLDPRRTALRTGTETVTYGELELRSNQLASWLRARGIGRGALVGLCVERSADMVVTQLAILKSGAAYVPLDPAYPAERLAYMAQDAKLALMVSQSSLSELVSWPREATVLIDSDAALLAAQPARRLVPDTALDARPDDPAYAIYTSGSSGKPKGVVVPHRAVVNFLTSMAREPGLSASDRLLAVTTLSFDIAVLELLLPLSVGAEVVLASADDVMSGATLHTLIDDNAVTVMQATPGTWQMLIDAGWSGSAGFKALVGGESLPRGLANQLMERSGQLWNMYGPTETTVWSTCGKVENPERGISIGRPIDNTQVHILDDHGQPCPIGVAGEIAIGGDGVALGYLNRPELTAERFIGDPFDSAGRRRLYRTGDLGRWCSNGTLEHRGRLDSQVKVRGHRIELGEIEANLLTHPQVAQAVVIVREDSPGDLRLVSYVVAKGPMPSANALREHLRVQVPQYMLPQHVVQINVIPRLPNGKIDRRSLPHPGASSVERASPAQPIHNPAQAAIAGIWEELLAIDQVQVTDNFFDLGGHSLLAARAVAKMEHRLGVPIDLRRLIFESLGQLAATAADRAASVALQTVRKSVPKSVAKSGVLGRLMGALRAHGNET